ncbi:MAG: NADPH:quinone oxidoreductase family protein [Aestuariivita sp.]|nr:NADPH:quinone oxidoreductase family protein [Aestuariivita sp.]
MKAWISGKERGIEALAFDDVIVPNPADNELLIRVSHTALNFSDLLMLEDKYQVRPPRPFIPGQEISGIVVKAPSKSTFKLGDRVTSKVIWGGFAEYVTVRADMAIPVPPGICLTQATALPISYVTALVALNYCASLSASDCVLIHAAAGGVGLAAVEIATARGARVIATARSDKRLAVAIERGAERGVNYSEENWFDRVNDITEGRGANIILDPVGGHIGEDSLRCIAIDGTLLIVGFASGFVPKLPAHRLLLKRASAHGVYWNHDIDMELLNAATSDLNALLINRELDPLVNTDYQFDALPQALKDLAGRKVIGKVVLKVSSDGTGE